MLFSPEIEVDGSFGGFGIKVDKKRNVEDFKDEYLGSMPVLGKDFKRRRNIKIKIARFKHIITFSNFALKTCER